MLEQIPSATKAMIGSWARSFGTAVIALYMSGVTDPKMLANAGIAAVLPVIYRYLNTNDTTFGKGSEK
jgi:hypothetical protein